MRADPAAITAEVRAIAGSARNRNRPVVLCEGETVARTDPTHRPSPSRYRRCAHLPDASFYKKCVPPTWRQHRPEFYNCGGRTQVLATWRGLQALSELEPDKTFIDAERLFALVDLDLHPQPLEGEWESVEALHAAAYTPPGAASSVGLRRPVDRRHVLWVTALIHKEAFFLSPLVADAIEASEHTFEGLPFDLAAVHRAAAERIDTDGELRARFDAVKGRVAPCAAELGLDLADVDTFARSWLDAARSGSPDCYPALVDALFLLTKAKPLWQRIGPAPDVDWTRGDAAWRDQVELAIAEHISGLAPHAHPIAGLMDWLRAHG